MINSCNSCGFLSGNTLFRSVSVVVANSEGGQVPHIEANVLLCPGCYGEHVIPFLKETVRWSDRNLLKEIKNESSTST